MFKPVIRKFERTGRGHPDQWEGKTAKGKPFYIRYRFKRLMAVVDGALLMDRHYVDHVDSLTLMRDLNSVFRITNTAKREFLDG